MKTSLMLLSVALWTACAAPALDVPSTDDQIASAILAAPEEYRAKAGVLGYDAQGKQVTLREAENDLICSADNPKREGFSVSCEHWELARYRARRSELRSQGLSGEEPRAALRKEIEDGKLPWTRAPRMRYRLHGTGFDTVSGQVTDPHPRWQIFVPYATPESTGLSTESAWDTPWLMYAGTPLAHIMISPHPRNKQR